MQTCEKCHTKLKWADIYKSVLWRKNEKPKVYCRQCETEHVITLESRIIDWFLIVLVGIFTILLAFNLINKVGVILYFIIFISTYLFLLALIYTVIPFIYKFHSKYHTNYEV